MQGAGAAIVTPLTLTLLAEAFPAERRGMAIGVWSGISGIAVAIGPLVGGAVVQGISWHWIFWINVPIGIVLIPLAARRLTESRGPYGTLDLPGLVLASTGTFGLVFGLVRAQSLGWTSADGPHVADRRRGRCSRASSLWELRATRADAADVVLRQALVRGDERRLADACTSACSARSSFSPSTCRTCSHNTPLQAGLKLLVWTGATMVVAPLAGVFSERFGSRPFMFAGLSLAGGCAGVVRDDRPPRDLPYSHMLIPFIMAGSGMALVFAPSANAVLASVRADQAGQASGANNAIREVGGVLGVAVLASVFTGAGGYTSPQAFVNGLVPAMWVGVAVLAAGALVVLALPFRTRATADTPVSAATASARRRGEGGATRPTARSGARRGGGVSDASAADSDGLCHGAGTVAEARPGGGADRTR